MKTRLTLITLALLFAAALPGCESFYGLADEQGHAVPDEVRQADAERRIAALQDAHDRVSDAIDAILAEREVVELEVESLRAQVDILSEAGADTAAVEAALSVAQDTADALAGRGVLLQSKLGEVDAVLAGVAADVESGVLGGPAVETKAVIDSAAAIAPSFGPYGVAISAGLTLISGVLLRRGQRFKAERDRKSQANRGLVDSVDALLNSHLVGSSKADAKKLLASTQTPEARAEVRRVLAGIE